MCYVDKLKIPYLALQAKTVLKLKVRRDKSHEENILHNLLDGYVAGYLQNKKKIIILLF